MFQPTQDEDMRAFALWSVVVIVTMVGCTILEPDETGEGDVELARGEDLYRANCMDCHGGASGGNIADVPPPHNAEGHTWHHGDCELAEMTRRAVPTGGLSTGGLLTCGFASSGDKPPDGSARVRPQSSPCSAVS
jgi:hypothetical protein